MTTLNRDPTKYRNWIIYKLERKDFVTSLEELQGEPKMILREEGM